MKKVTCKVFFTVMWRGVSQMVKWFFGLFGYKREGNFAKCVWGLFAISSTIVMAVIAYAALNSVYVTVTRKYSQQRYEERCGGYWVSQNIKYINDYNGNDGYLYNVDTGKKVLKGIEWVASPAGKDTLVCYSDGKKRGYFDQKDGRVVIEPKYDHAWIFAEGVAAVDMNGKISFIDGTGKVVIADCMSYYPESDNYVFHNGYLVVGDDDRERFGLMNKSGKMLLPVEYDDIEVDYNHMCVCARKDDKCTVYDKDMNVVLADIEGTVYLASKFIDVTMAADNTMRKYDYEGNLVHDFYISEVNHLEYATGEIYYAKDSYYNDDEEEVEYLTEEHKKANARLMCYSTDDHVGLMTAEGKIITMPLYKSIEAVGPDTYLCEVSENDKVVVNGKGEVVK